MLLLFHEFMYLKTFIHYLSCPWHLKLPCDLNNNCKNNIITKHAQICTEKWKTIIIHCQTLCTSNGKSWEQKVVLKETQNSIDFPPPPSKKKYIGKPGVFTHMAWQFLLMDIYIFIMENLYWPECTSGRQMPLFWFPLYIYRITCPPTLYKVQRQFKLLTWKTCFECYPCTLLSRNYAWAWRE